MYKPHAWLRQGWNTIITWKCKRCRQTYTHNYANYDSKYIPPSLSLSLSTSYVHKIPGHRHVG